MTLNIRNSIVMNPKFPQFMSFYLERFLSFFSFLFNTTEWLSCFRECANQK